MEIIHNNVQQVYTHTHIYIYIYVYMYIHPYRRILHFENCRCHNVRVMFGVHVCAS